MAVEEKESEGVRVTLKDVHRDLQEMKELLLKLSLRLPSTEERFAEFEERTHVKFEDHEDRLRRVESRIWQAVGGFGLLAALVPIITTILKQ